jgi:hypothetical protein
VRGLPEPEELRVRPGAGRRSLHPGAAEDGLPLSAGGHPVAGRPLPGFRRRCPGHGGRRRRRRGGAQAPGGRAARRRSHPRRDPRLGPQQRRLEQAGLHRSQHRGAGGGRRRGPGPRRGGARLHHLRRGARHGHAAGRSDRGRGPDPGLPRIHAAPELLRAGSGEEQRRPPRRRRRGRRPDQDRARPGARGDPSDPPLPAPESRAPAGVEPVLRQLHPDPLAARGVPAAGGRELLRAGRDQRPRGAGGGPAPRARGRRGARERRARLAPVRPVGPQRQRSRFGRRQPGGLDRPPSRGPSRRRGLDTPERPPGLPAPARPGRPGPGAGSAPAARGGFRGSLHQRGGGAPAGVPPPPGARPPARRHGARAVSGGAGLPPADRPLRQEPAALPGDGPPGGAPSAGRRRGGGGAPARPLRGGAPGPLRPGVRAGRAVERLGGEAGGDDRPQPGRVDGRLPCWRLLGRGRPGSARRARPAHGCPARGRDAQRPPARA